MVAAVDDKIGWITPAPMWSGFEDLGDADTRDAFVRPALLRFANDEFMDELQAALAYYPGRLGEWQAVPETWETPAPRPTVADRLAVQEPPRGLLANLKRQLADQERLDAAQNPPEPEPEPEDGSGDAAEREGKLKLYQPVQNRHYLVAASLVCLQPGLPDRRLDLGKGEQTAFVMRRLIPPDDFDPQNPTPPAAWDEHAFLPEGETGVWVPVDPAEPDALMPGEERIPLFRLGFEAEDDRRRHLFGGVVPVGRRETYVGARMGILPEVAAGEVRRPQPTAERPDPRLTLFQMRVTGPWSELVTQAYDEIEKIDRSDRRVGVAQVIRDEFGSPPTGANTPLRNQVLDQLQTTSWYLVLDLERFLYHHVNNLWKVIKGGLDAPTPSPEEDLLLTGLEGFRFVGADPDDPATLREAVARLVQDPTIGEALEDIEDPYVSSPRTPGWPLFDCLLAASDDTGPFPFEVNGTDLSGHRTPGDAMRDRTQVLDAIASALAGLEALVDDALPRDANVRLPEISIPGEDDITPGDAWFQIRCVYDRPNCGPLQPRVMSEPSEPFIMASFFDPDAPARAVRIPMPFDISPAGLRKFNRSTTLMISDMLCGQIRRIRKLTLGDLVLSVLPWPFHKDLPDPSAGGPCKDGGSNPLGMFCSLSIPIVTLCALILLIIMVTLFDYFFRWLPYLFVCFPIRGLRGKQQ